MINYGVLPYTITSALVSFLIMGLILWVIVEADRGNLL